MNSEVIKRRLKAMLNMEQYFKKVLRTQEWLGEAYADLAQAETEVKARTRGADREKALAEDYKILIAKDRIGWSMKEIDLYWQILKEAMEILIETMENDEE